MQELPDSALISLLKGDDPASRTRAIHLLGERAVTAAVLPLIEAMEDASLRPAIAGALTRMKARAAPALIRLLDSPDPRHRKHAAFVLGEFRSGAVAKPLAALLGDISRDVRTAASEALGKTGEDALAELRVAIRNPDPDVRTGIADALGRMVMEKPSGREKPESRENSPEDDGAPGGPQDASGGEDRSGLPDPGGKKRPAENEPFAPSPKNRELAFSLLMQLLDDENPRVRDAAAAALHRAGSLPAVPGGLESPDPRARKDAIRALGEGLLIQKTGAAIPLLIEALFDEDPEIRLLAARSLRNTGDPRTVMPLNACLLDVSPDVRQEAVEGLRRRKDLRALDPLVHALRDDSPGVRLAAACALGEFSDPVSRDALAQCMHDGDRPVREAAARSLAKLGPDPRLDPHILVRSPDPEKRSDALRGLGRQKDANDLGLITGALRDNNAGVRSAAAEALCSFSDAAAVPPLLNALSDTDEHVRMYALRALQEIDDPRVLIPLIYALKDSHALVRAEAVTHLGKLGDGEAVPYLIEALGDPDAGVCREAILLLGNIGGERTGALLQDLEQRTHDPLKLAAVRTALDQIARMKKAGSVTRAGSSGAGPPDGTTPDQVSRTPRQGAATHGDEHGAGAGRTALNRIARIQKAGSVTRAESSGAGAPDGTALDQVSRTTRQGAATRDDEPGAGAGRTAPGQIARMQKAGSVTRAESSGAGAPDGTAPDQVSRTTRPGPGTRGKPPGAGAADRVVISRKKNVEPAQPHPLRATPQREPETPAGDLPESLPLQETDPRSARMWQDLLDAAGGYIEKEAFESAKPLLERAWKISPDSELLVTLLGLTLSSLGRYEEALGVYKKGLAINPRNDVFWSNAGALLANLERYDEALRSYKRALALCMSDEKVWYQTGIVLNNLGRYEEAVKCFDRALLLNPAFPEAAEAGRIARGNVWGQLS